MKEIKIDSLLQRKTKTYISLVPMKNVSGQKHDSLNFQLNLDVNLEQWLKLRLD